MISALNRTGWSRAMHPRLRPLLEVCAGLLVIALAAARPASGQTVRATVSVDSVYVGDRFTLSLVATHRSSSVTFPSATAGGGIFGDVEAMGRTAVTTRSLRPHDPGVRIDSVAYEVTTFALDTAYVPALSVQFVAGADTVRAASSPLYIPVRSVVPPAAQRLRGLAPLASFSDSRWPWGLLFLVALLLVAGFVYYWRRRQAASEAPPPPAPEPSLPPHEAARRRMQRLETATDWSDPAAIERLFVELAMTVRAYVARQLGIAALERTTGELITALRAAPTPPPSAVDAVRDVLEQADLVKFADAGPTGPQARTALRTARAAIEDIERATQARSAPAAASSSKSSAS